MSLTSSTLGQRLQQARKAANMSQTDLAVHAGMTQASISDLEREKSVATTFVPQIAHALCVNGLWLATGQGNMRESQDSIRFEYRQMIDREVKKAKACLYLDQSIASLGLLISEMEGDQSLIEQVRPLRERLGEIKLLIISGSQSHSVK